MKQSLIKETKQCNKCYKTKIMSEFPKLKGEVPDFGWACKKCVRIKHREIYEGRKEKVRSQKKEYYLKNRDKFDEKSRKMVIERSPKYVARYLLRSAVSSGKVVKLACERCGDIKTQGHHPDYSKPLKVIWLCRKHHGEIHRIKV